MIVGRRDSKKTVSPIGRVAALYGLVSVNIRIVINIKQRRSACGLHSSASDLASRVKQKLAPRGE